MKIIGIVAVKEQSKRFPFKNFYKINGAELFLNNVDRIMEAGYSCYVATNSKLAINICNERCIKYIFRGENISESEQPIFEVIKWAYQSIAEKADIVIFVLANTYKLEATDINKAVDVLVKNDLKEVRSYDKSGKENGLLVMTSDYLLSKHELSTYTGAVITNSKEIHYEKDFKE